MIAGIAVGDVVGEREVHLSRENLVRYAGASGDFNPIHYRDDVAARVGLPGVLAHGMLTMGIAIETVAGWIADHGELVEYGVRFTRPVVVDPDNGAVVVVRGVVGAVDEGAVRIDLTVTSDGVTVLGKAQARVRVTEPGDSNA